jgi:hypothetical protein
MKLLVPATILCFALAAPVYAHQQEQQEQQQDKDKQKQEEKQKQDEKQKQETEKQQPDKAKQYEKAKQQDDRAKQDERAKQDIKQRQDQDKQQEQMRKQNDQRSNERVTQQRTQTRTISDAEFHQHFGREHHFRVGHVDNDRFAYGGYTFAYSEAWPVGWGYDDDFYIDYIDGQYYLIDLSHPGPRLVLVIVD